MSKRKISDIFHNVSAWFASSVDKRYKQIWAGNGGIVVNNTSKALYIFSNDPEASDTKSLYQSDAYVDGLTVLKPSFIDACLQGGDAHKIKLSLFILHPTEVAEVMNTKRKKIQLLRGKGRPGDGPPLITKQSSTSAGTVWHMNLTSTDTDGSMTDLDSVPHVNDVPKFVGNLQDLVAENDGFEITRI